MRHAATNSGCRRKAIVSTIQIPEICDCPETPTVESPEAGLMAIAVIDSDTNRRLRVVGALKNPQLHFRLIVDKSAYQPDNDYGNWLSRNGIDVALVCLDDETEKAFETIEAISADGSVIVIAYSGQANSTMLLRCMRAGAREFLKYPLDIDEVAQALHRAGSRTPLLPMQKNVGYGKLFAFLGCKGGVGVTTVACNFAVSLGKESGKKVLLVDLNLPLGDAALSFGLKPLFSTIDALVNTARLDTFFLRTLVMEHSSGISVLAAPGAHSVVEIPDASIQKLLAVARQEFDYVVVDAGAATGLIESLSLQLATKIYLVAQTGIPELRNANRLITGWLSEYASKLEVVLNRCSANAMGIDEGAIVKALTRTPDWRVPNDYQEVRTMQNTATPLVLNDTPIARSISGMARNACGITVEPGRKKKFSFFRALHGDSGPEGSRP